MLSLFFAGFLFLAFALLVVLDKEILALKILLVLMMFSAYPLNNSYFNIGMEIELSIILIFAIIAGKLFRDGSFSSRENSISNLSKYFPVLYYFLFAGIILGLIYHQAGLHYLEGVRTHPLSPYEQIILNSLNIAVVILFLKILIPYQYNKKILHQFSVAFSSTIFILVISQFFFKGLWENSFFYFTGKLPTIFGVRNFGLWNGFGLGVYTVLVMFFSLVYFEKHKIFSSLTILFAIIFSLANGSRQIIVLVGIFSAAAICIYLVNGKISIRKGIISLMLIIVVGFIGKSFLFSDVTVFERFSLVDKYLNNDEFLRATGRDALGLPYVMDDLSNYPVWGKGSLDLNMTKGSLTNLAGHVIWINIYKKYGIIGPVFLFLIIALPAGKIYLICRRNKNSPYFYEGALLFALMAVIFCQQFLDNFFWYSKTMIFYGFIYFWVYSYINRSYKYHSGEEAIEK